MNEKDRASRLGIKEWLSLLWLNYKVQIKNTKEFFVIVFKYYNNLSFLKADLSLRLMYLFHNPYTISKRFLMKRGENEVYAYGETPLTTLETISQECKIGPKDTVFELGCGRGRTCFWLNSFTKCKVVGIEYIPEFVDRAKRIKNKLEIDGVEFRQEDFCKADYSKATICYLYGTCLDEQSILTLIKKFSTLPIGTKIITVSYPLSDYTTDTRFEVMKRFIGKFTWGETDIYLQVIK